MCVDASIPVSIAVLNNPSLRSNFPSWIKSQALVPRTTARTAAFAAGELPQSRMIFALLAEISISFVVNASPMSTSSPSAGAAIPSLIGFAPSSILAIISNFSAIERSSLSRITSLS